MDALRKLARKAALTCALILAATAVSAVPSAPLGSQLFAPTLALAEEETALTCGDYQDVSPALLAQAQQFTLANSGISLTSDTNYPNPETLGLATVGEARVAVIRVSFPASEDGSEPAYTFPSSQPDDELLSMFNGEQDSASDCYPYESLHAYYERASYGAFDIQAKTVVNYTAKYPRSHYETEIVPSELLAEAIEGVDGAADFSACDANNDGYVDAVYFQYAGPTGEWATTWWPKQITASNYQTLASVGVDGKHLLKLAMIASGEGEQYNTKVKQLRAIIHETGHILGLPDLYSYGEGINRGPGVGTFDMMDDDTGDQNGFFKWMLGWIPADKITFVHTNENGVDVRRGSGDIVHYDDSATLDLTPYTSDETDETGGFIAVSADKSILEGNLFCKFYLLQFDHAAGNQAVKNGDTILGHGVRAFRVSAELDPYKREFNLSNTSGMKYSQLFEVVDPTEGGATAEFGRFLRMGTTVSPSSKPSSNFATSEGLGYSGITFEVAAETEQSANVKVWWTKQSESASLTLTPAADYALGGYRTLQFKTSVGATQNYVQKQVFIVVDGEKHLCRDYFEKNSTLTVTSTLSTQYLASHSNIELLVEEGYFDLGYDADGTHRYSEEIRLPLQIANIPAIDSTGLYEKTESGVGRRRLTSQVFTDADGRSHFIAITNMNSAIDRKALLVNLGGDGEPQSVVELPDNAIMWGQDGILTLEAFSLDDGSIFIRSQGDAGTAGGKTAELHTWIDPKSGSVQTRKLVNAVSTREWLAIGTYIASVSTISTGTNPPSVTLVEHDGTNTTEHQTSLLLPEGFGRVSGTLDASEDYVIVYGQGREDTGAITKFLLYRKQDIAANPNGSVSSTASFTTDHDYGLLYQAKIKNDKLYIVCTHHDSTSEDWGVQLRTYSLDGELLGATDLDTYVTDWSTIKVSDTGAVACLTNQTVSTGDFLHAKITDGQTLLIDPQTSTVYELAGKGSAIGTWIGNQWLTISEDLEGNEEGTKTQLRWLLTAGIGTSDQDSDTDPDPDSTPKPDATNGDENQTPGTRDTPCANNVSKTAGVTAVNKASLPNTGDETGSISALLLAAGTALLGAAWRTEPARAKRDTRR